MKYWLSPKISYSAWQKINAKFPDVGIKPKEIDTILWEMLMKFYNLTWREGRLALFWNK